MNAKLCDSCKTTSANLFCKADSAFLCLGCDSKIHAANKLASRHARVSMCEVCEQSPAAVTCKADAAALCVTCDRDIHSANPLARRHERFPVVPFYDSAAKSDVHGVAPEDDRYFSGGDASDSEEAEAASWLLPNPNPNKYGGDCATDLKNSDYLFNEVEVEPYVDFGVESKVQKLILQHNNNNNNNGQYSCGTDGVVPVRSKDEPKSAVVDGFPAYSGLDYTGSKPFMYNFNTQSISQSVCIHFYI